MPENKNANLENKPKEKPSVEVDVIVEEPGAVAKTTVAANGSRFLAISILVAAVLVCGTLIYVLGPSKFGGVAQPSGSATTTAAIVWPSFPTSLPYPQTTEGNEVVLGNPKAPVQLVEYGDYQCSYCSMYFNQTEPLIRQSYVASGTVREVFKNLVVIDNFVAGGHESEDSALAASCAMDQNKFWEYHDALYMFKTVNPGENAGNLTEAVFTEIANKLGMNVGQFTSCFDSKKYSSLIASDIKQASSIFTQAATPSFTVNGQAVQGAEPFSAFQTIINAALKKVGK